MKLDFDNFDDDTILAVGYFAPNETIEAVVKGLDINSEDTVLTIKLAQRTPFPQERR